MTSNVIQVIKAFMAKTKLQLLYMIPHLKASARAYWYIQLHVPMSFYDIVDIIQSHAHTFCINFA